MFLYVVLLYTTKPLQNYKKNKILTTKIKKMTEKDFLGLKPGYTIAEKRDGYTVMGRVTYIGKEDILVRWNEKSGLCKINIIDCRYIGLVKFTLRDPEPVVLLESLPDNKK
ncbi:hypothetical protein FACS1894153_0520 [Bacteroidia bacterium]|nr:hypothetical protein FACS1894153_0520 [Bacteroidia bacterium]